MLPALFSLVASVLVPVFVPPLGSSRHWQDGKGQAILGDQDFTEWNLDEFPNPNHTNHLVFETVHSLLQHWPNTRMRNGHNIVPGVIPKGTLLYHSTYRKKLPPGPGWVVTDPEHSHVLCMHGFIPDQHSCWLHTLATNRPLKVIYFDGTSAAKIPCGTADTQELIAWHNIHGGNPDEELHLLQDLCRWGNKFGVDGFVRMEMDFEIMLCGFTSGLSVVSSSNLPSRGAFLPMQPGFIAVEVIDAGSWHNHFPGEIRVQLDLTRLVSFYDTQLVPSLVSVRAGQERWDHRAGNISNDDLSVVKSKTEAILAGPSGSSSGIDWKTLIQVIVDRFAGRLELIRHLLNLSATDLDETLDIIKITQIQLRTMLTPYLLLSASPTTLIDDTDLAWTKPIFKLCATTHTYAMEPELDSMTDSEKLLLRAVRGTTREICRVVTRMWAAGVYAGLDPSLNTKASPDVVQVMHVWDAWAEDLSRLMSWLDWSVWVKCNPECGPEELCYLPTWPIGFPFPWGPPDNRPSLPNPDKRHSKRVTSFDVRKVVMKNLVEEAWNTVKPDPDEWIRPQPRCIRRVAPHGNFEPLIQ